MLLVADVHGAVDGLGRVAAKAKASREPLLILGDLINFIDYRDLSGIVADVCGEAFVADMVALRTAGEMAAAGRLWKNFSEGREESIREEYGVRIEAEYVQIGMALDGAEVYVIHGNVDQPDRLVRNMPDSVRYVESGVVEIEGLRVGLVSGGLPSLGTPGEVSHDEMALRLADLGPVDVLCTHVPPAVRVLAGDVIGGRKEGSQPILDYLAAHRPEFHYFGDIHQPQATNWRVGATACRNVGYFRATGRAVRHR
ncbi:MAG: metallophosphoesterase [Acidimicrobiia bacterium]|nr:metallophosphoesterase [Acidimicrobiia bacterium]NNF64876.1 metallophosphoesterase [Acidimicrobiia bacterium]